MSVLGLIAWSLVLAVVAMAIAIVEHLRARRLRADRDRISAELDAAYQAAAELAVERRELISDVACLRRVLHEVREVLVAVEPGGVWSLHSTADLARRLVAERNRGAAWDRADAEELIATIESDLADPSGDASARPEWRAGWDAALREYGTPMIAMLRSAVAELDSLETELRAVTADRDAIAARAAESERREARTFVRSLKRRRAIVRIARYCRAQDLALGAAIDAGLELGDQCNRRDLAIDALTARVAELMPCADRAEYVDGELDADRADAFRAHLTACKSCQAWLLEDVRLDARLSTLGGS